MPASIFAGSKVKTLKDTLTLNGKSDIISSTVDPTASAVDAPIGSLLINQTSGKLYRKLDAGSSVNWEEVGSGTGGINYILNPSAEVNTTGWATYADAAGAAPVDGTGGSPNVTWTRSTTSPLRGVADFNFAKDAANRQGQGVSYDFTIDEADKAKVLSVTFDYEVLSGTYANADLTVYLIADPTGTPVVIQPAGYTVQAATVGTTMRQIATFQTQATGLSYRLCFHVASVSASAYALAVDNVVVGPQQTVQGAAISDWVSFTPTGSWAANTTYTGRWKRVGDSVQVQASLSLTGAPTATRLTINLPSGLVIDNTKRSGGASATINNIFGTGKTFDGATAVHNLTVAYESTTAVAVSYESTATAQLNNVTNTSPFTYNSGDVLDIEYTVPITGWSSNTVLSQDTDTRVVAARATSAITGVVAGDATVIYPTLVNDTHGSYSAATGIYTVSVSGFYRATASIFFDVYSWTAGDLVDLRINCAGTIVSRNYYRMPTLTSKQISADTCSTFYATAGQQITVSASQNVGGTRNLDGNSSLNYFTVERLSGPATIAASEFVGASFKDSTTTLSSGGATLVFPSAGKIYDSHGAMNTSTGIYTVPVSGKYSISCFLITSITTGISSITLNAFQTGSDARSVELQRQDVKTGLTSSSGRKLLQGDATFSCLAGDTLYVVGYDPDATSAIAGTRLSITRIG